MAESDAKYINIEEKEEMKEHEDEQRLRHLEFVHVVAIHVVVWVARMYQYAKDNAGPLKPGVQSVEGTVMTVVDKYRGIPMDFLKFVDRKVDDSIHKLERHVPSVIKEAPSKAKSAAAEFQKAGMVGTAASLARSAYTKAQPAAKGLYSKYEPTAEQYVLAIWRLLNRLPLVHQMMNNVVIPTAAQLSERYNSAVNYSAEKGYTVSTYLPLIPTDRIAKVFEPRVETIEPRVEIVA